VAVAFAAVLAVAACGGGTNATANGTGGVHHGAATITIKDFGYTGDLTVEPGAHVTVVNNDSVAHTLTDKTNGLFDTGSISRGGTASFIAPTHPGKYPFGCTLHPEMTGVLTVAGG
jgi:plastocyanin